MQSLLRGRFLRNNRSTEDEKPTSVAASELGLLRQRRTVAGLRYYLYYAVCIKQIMYFFRFFAADFLLYALFLLMFYYGPLFWCLICNFLSCSFNFFSVILCMYVGRGCFCVWRLLVGGLLLKRKLCRGN